MWYGFLNYVDEGMAKFRKYMSTRRGMTLNDLSSGEYFAASGGAGIVIARIRFG